MNRFLARFEQGRIVSAALPERHRDCLVFWRGYIANPGEISEAAAKQGFPTVDETEGGLFVLAFHLWGTALQSRVLGEYALALFHEPAGLLLLTHDGLGLLPLFYGARPHGLIFASHLEDLVRETGTGELDEEYIADYVATGSYTTHRTPYRAIQRLRFGQSLIHERGRAALRRTWSLSRAPAPLADDRAYEEQFRATLQRGVQASLRAPGPVWTELSGGLDSSTVAACAARGGDARLKAISLVYRRYSDADESAWMRIVSEHCRLPRIDLAADEALPFSELPDRFCAEPGAGQVDWGWRRKFEDLVRAHGVAAVLTGQGGDLVMFSHGAEPLHLADLARTGRWRALFPELSRWQAGDVQHRSHLHGLVRYVARPLIAYLRRRPLRPAALGNAPSLISSRYAARMNLGARGAQDLAERGSSVAEYGFTLELAAFCSRMAHLNQMPEEFEFRHPLLYRPLVEFMFHLTPAQKLHPHMERYLQRRALAGILPEAVRMRRDKTIFDQPYYEGLRLGRAWTTLLTQDPCIVQRGIVPAREWNEAVAQARLGRTGRLREFESLAVLEIWLRQLERPWAHVASGPMTAAT